MVFCYILWTFGIIHNNLVHFSRFGVLYREKSGNPGLWVLEQRGRWHAWSERKSKQQKKWPDHLFCRLKKRRFKTRTGKKCRAQGCQMAFFQTKKSHFGQILEGLAIEGVGIFYVHLVYIIAILSSFCIFLWLFGIFFPFWYALPRKIWQAWSVRANWK
jgi:hypothetical protein